MPRCVYLNLSTSSVFSGRLVIYREVIKIVKSLWIYFQITLTPKNSLSNSSSILKLCENNVIVQTDMPCEYIMYMYVCERVSITVMIYNVDCSHFVLSK